MILTLLYSYAGDVIILGIAAVAKPSIMVQRMSFLCHVNCHTVISQPPPPTCTTCNVIHLLPIDLSCIVLILM